VTQTREQTKNYVNAFAGAVAALGRPGDDITSRALEILVADFDALRAELWLWDTPSKTCYLTDQSGQRAGHRLDYATAGSGVIGKI